jgi:hypothetical protein
LYMLPISIYMNFNRQMSLKEKFLERRKNWKIKDLERQTYLFAFFYFLWYNICVRC